MRLIFDGFDTVFLFLARIVQRGEIGRNINIIYKGAISLVKPAKAGGIP